MRMMITILPKFLINLKRFDIKQKKELLGHLSVSLLFHLRYYSSEIGAYLWIKGRIVILFERLTFPIRKKNKRMIRSRWFLISFIALLILYLFSD